MLNPHFIFVVKDIKFTNPSNYVAKIKHLARFNVIKKSSSPIPPVMSSSSNV